MDRIGNINIIQVVDVAGNGNMVRIGKYYRKWKYCRKRKYYRNRKIIPETEILNICSKRKLIPESEILNIVRIGNEFRNRKFNRKRIVRISIGRGLSDEAQHEARPSPSKPSAPHKQQGQAQQAARSAHSAHSARSAQRARALSGLLLARTHGAHRGCRACVCKCLCSCTFPKTCRVRLMIKFLILFDKLIKLEFL